MAFYGDGKHNENMEASFTPKKQKQDGELQALQNAADDLNLKVHEKHFYEDRRKTIKMYFAQRGTETVSPVLDYEQLNHFLLGWRRAVKKHSKVESGVYDEFANWCKKQKKEYLQKTSTTQLFNKFINDFIINNPDSYSKLSNIINEAEK